MLDAIHRRVLPGQAPELVARYPSTGGDSDAAAAMGANLTRAPAGTATVVMNSYAWQYLSAGAEALVRRRRRGPRATLRSPTSRSRPSTPTTTTPSSG